MAADHAADPFDVFDSDAIASPARVSEPLQRAANHPHFLSCRGIWPRAAPAGEPHWRDALLRYSESRSEACEKGLRKSCSGYARSCARSLREASRAFADDAAGGGAHARAVRELSATALDEADWDVSEWQEANLLAIGYLLAALLAEAPADSGDASHAEAVGKEAIALFNLGVSTACGVADGLADRPAWMGWVGLLLAATEAAEAARADASAARAEVEAARAATVAAAQRADEGRATHDAVARALANVIATRDEPPPPPLPPPAPPALDATAIAARAVLAAALDHALPAVARASDGAFDAAPAIGDEPLDALARRASACLHAAAVALAPAPAPVQALAPAPARRGTPGAHELDDASLDDGAEDAEDDALAELGLGARYLVWANSRRGDAGLVYPAYAPPSPQRSARPSSGRLARARAHLARLSSSRAR